LNIIGATSIADLSTCLHPYCYQSKLFAMLSVRGLLLCLRALTLNNFTHIDAVRLLSRRVEKFNPPYFTNCMPCYADVKAVEGEVIHRWS